jgi:hypothetical protein
MVTAVRTSDPIKLIKFVSQKIIQEANDHLKTDESDVTLFLKEITIE